MKRCIKCSIYKESTGFHRLTRSKDGYRDTCKVCHNQEAKVYYANNKVTVREDNGKKGAKW